MKTIKLAQLFRMLIAMVLLISCVEDDDFAVPDLTVEEPNLEGEVIAIDGLVSLYEQALNQAVLDLGFDPDDLDFDQDLFDEALENIRNGFTLDLSESTQFISGYVISSDESGNWFEELILQNAAENPNAGVRVLVDVNPLFSRYEVGRRVFVKLRGLHIGDNNGVLTLGVTNGLEKIAAAVESDFIRRSTEVGTLVPLEISISDFDESLENLYVRLSDMQFIREEAIDASFTFAAEPTDEFDGERTLMNCANNQMVILSTSTFSDFKALSLPTGRGTIDGILTRNFFGNVFNFVINDTSTIVFDQTNRCDPALIDCGVAGNAGSVILFEDFFETQNTNEPISGNGWTNFTEVGTEAWEAFSSGGQNASLGISARIGSFMSGDTSTIAWLVTPQLNLDAQDGETLQFMTSNSFSDGSVLELLFSSDWDGVPENIPSTTWSILSAGVIVENDEFFGNWVDSGIIDLSCIEESGYIGFRYIGSGASELDGTYELDEIQINAQ